MFIHNHPLFLVDHVVNPMKKRGYNTPKLLIRKDKHYSIQDVLKHVRLDLTKAQGGKEKVDFDGTPVNMASDRYKCFAISGTVCKECGLEGKYFCLEQFTNNPGNGSWHFNLYGIDKYGREVLITKDHVIPHSKGGVSHVLNYQTLCYFCNMAKGSKLPENYVTAHMHPPPKEPTDVSGD